MVKLLIISPGFPVNESDSTCLPFIQLYLKELLKNKSVEIKIITEQYPASSNYFWNGIEVRTLQKKEPKLITKLFRRLRLKKALVQLQKQNNFNVIHNFWFSNSTFIINNFANKNHIKHITTFSGQDVLPSNKALRKLNEYKGQLFCLSAFHKMVFEKNYKIPLEIIEWGIEKIEVENPSKEIDLLFCGWITELKNYKQFIEIVTHLNQQNFLKKVVMCGGGNNLEALKQEIKFKNLEKLVELTGEIPRNEVLNFMKKSNIFIHTSSFESYGLVLVEAIACKCSVISKPVGIAYNNSEITTCETSDQFVNAIKSKLLTESKPNEKPKKYLIENTCNKYLEVYAK